MSQLPSESENTQGPDSHLETLIAQVKQTTEAWAIRHDLWHDSGHQDPIQHYNDDPGEGSPMLLLCSDGPAMTSLEYDDEYAIELREELEKLGVFMEFEDRVTAQYFLIDETSELQKELDRYAQWKWTCKLIEADSADVSGDLYRYFSDNPDEFHRLPHREFEKLVSSIFAARGWKTELGPGSGDQGVDLRIWQSDAIGDLLTLVQIKRYAPHRPIHLDAVAALETHVNREGANRGLFVTSSRFLPGVEAFASREKYRLQLANPDNLQRWCEESAQAVLAARNRALAMESFGPLIEEIRLAGTHPRLVVGGSYTPSFCVVLRETRTSALLVPIPSLPAPGAMQPCKKVPLLCSLGQVPISGATAFRASRSETEGKVYYWAKRTIFRAWDGQPCGEEYWD